MTEHELQTEEMNCILRRNQSDAKHLLKISLIALDKGKLHIVKDHIDRAISYIK